MRLRLRRRNESKLRVQCRRENLARKAAEYSEELHQNEANARGELVWRQALGSLTELLAAQSISIDPEHGEECILLRGVVKHSVYDRGERDISERLLRPVPERRERALEGLNQLLRTQISHNPFGPVIHASAVIVVADHDRYSAAR